MVKIFLNSGTKYEDFLLDIEEINYPDGTKSFKIGGNVEKINSIGAESRIKVVFLYSGLSSCMDMYIIVDEVRRCFPYTPISLYISYMPYARMDRAKNAGETFALKSFARLLNSLDVNSIAIFDPHSHISEALVTKSYTRCRVMMDTMLVLILENHVKSSFMGDESFYVAFPDEGAKKRYGDIISMCNFQKRIDGYYVGRKDRNWADGKIKSLEISVEQKVMKSNEGSRNILIIDDICSYGGTFKAFIKKAKEIYEDSIFYLYVSHLEPAVLDGDLLEEPSLEKVFTTDSLSGLWSERDKFNDIISNDKVEIFSIPYDRCN